MTDKIITLLVGVLIALGGWTLTRTFDLSTNQAVNNDKVNKLERYVEKLQDQMDDMMDKDKEIIAIFSLGLSIEEIRKPIIFFSIIISIIYIYINRDMFFW